MEEEGAMSRGMQAASKNWKQQENKFPLEPLLCKVISFPGGSVGKESTCNAGDTGSIPGLGRSPGEGHGNPLQYSCLRLK